MMPDMDGFQVCSELKEDKKYTDIPILFITAMEAVEDKVKGFELGAADYITKPINPEEVKARVSAHLRLQQAVAESAIKKMIITYNHEMRQPLAAIGGYVDILLDEIDKEDENHEMLTIVSEQTTRIQKILDKIVSLDTFVSTDYIEGSSMIDLKLDEKDIKNDKSTPPEKRSPKK